MIYLQSRSHSDIRKNEADIHELMCYNLQTILLYGRKKSRHRRMEEGYLDLWKKRMEEFTHLYTHVLCTYIMLAHVHAYISVHMVYI